MLLEKVLNWLYCLNNQMKSFKQHILEMKVPPVGPVQPTSKDPNPERKPPEQQPQRKEDTVEISRTRLSDLADIGTNMEDAHFWITRKGSDKTVGSVTTKFSPEHIGVRVNRTDILDPRYAQYMMMHIHNTGYYRPHMVGSTNLMSIRAEHVRNIPISMR